MTVVNDEIEGTYILDTLGGTGKTFLISSIVGSIRWNNGIARALASSGIAATLLIWWSNCPLSVKIAIEYAEKRNTNLQHFKKFGNDEGFTTILTYGVRRMHDGP